MLRRSICLLAINLWLAACERQETPPAEPPTVSGAAAAPAAVEPAPEPTGTPPAAPVPDPRQAEAQAYLDQARVAAEQRHRKAMAHCETVPSDQRDPCIASAEEGLLAEMRAARVEFDARMSQPE